MKISVIIPTKDIQHSVDNVLEALTMQTLQPSEVVIVDSSKDDSIEKILKKYNSQLNFKYFYSVEGLFPGEARNKGLEMAQYPVIAFLDSKTVPVKDWLELSSRKLQTENYQVIFGSTLYLATTELQKIFQSSIYGKRPIETTPGSILTKDTANIIGKFAEGVRASEDQDWRNRIKESNLLSYFPETFNLTYSLISEKLSTELYRNYIYQLHTAKTDAQMHSKLFILGIFTTLLTLLTPSWNMIVGWEKSALYIPNITKIYLSSMLITIAIIFLFYQNKIQPILTRFILTAIGIAGFYIVYRWNGVISKSIDFIIYFPHITKMYIAALFGSGFIFRAFISPLSKGSSARDLLPLRWLKMGIACFLVDLVKLPGYLIGAILSISRMFIGPIYARISKMKRYIKLNLKN